MSRIAPILSLVLTVFGVNHASAQLPRHELGRRLRAMERAWDKQADPDVRARASKDLDRAVRAFLSMRLADASQALDEATLLLRAAGFEITTTQRWAAALDVVPEARLVEAGRKELKITFSQAYRVEPPIIDRVAVHVSFLGTGGASDPEASGFEIKTGSLPQTLNLSLAGLATGDSTLHVAFYSGKVLVGRAECTISLVARLQERLAAARACVDAWPEGEVRQSSDRLTAKGLLTQLESLAQGNSLETDIPAARRLETLESITAALKTHPDARFLGPANPGEFWVTLATAGPTSRAVPARLFVPAGLKADEPRPLVMALHGAGGSENMFFDGYGDGAIVRLCRERGWLLLAPRIGMLGGTPIKAAIDAANAHYPVDRQRILLVGHSMGAMLAVDAAVKDPNAYAGVAALGGGGNIGPRGAALKDLPFYIGVGSADFLHPGALALRDALERAGVREVAFKEYPEIEHLAIVQVALGDVFEFFDATVRRAPDAR